MRQLKKRQDLINKCTSDRNIAGMPRWATWTAEETVLYIENNVTDLVSAKNVLKKLAMMIIYLRDK